MKKIILLLPLLYCACSDRAPYSQEQCEILSMRIYQGIPNSQAQFKEHCSSVQVHYDGTICTAALKDLIATGNLELVQKKFGSLVVNCFTSGDLHRFSQPIEKDGN